MVIAYLSILIVIIIILGLIESYFHESHLKKIPVRVHVNGARGKSSVTRLIASGLRESEKKVYAKTTGSSPRIIDDFGKDIVIHRLRSASIGEQVKLIRSLAKKEIDILIIECMAVQPQYQWVSERKMIKSSIGVMTNVRLDHLDEMGYSLNDIAMSLSNTIPDNGTFITHDDEFSSLFSSISKKRGTEHKLVTRNSVTENFMRRFDYFEHKENVELALEVCIHLGMDKKNALEGMLKNNPDPGALFIWKIKIFESTNFFISAFAANDPQSTYDIFNKINNRYGDYKKCIFLNTRSDRQYRTHQLLSLITEKIIPNKLIIRTSKLDSLISKFDFESKGIELIAYDTKSDWQEIIDKIGEMNGYLVFGIGNIVGWGDKFVQKIKEYRIDG